MKKQEAINILIEANRWRRGAKIEMPNPKEFGEAIDYAVKFMKKVEIERPNYANIR